MKGRCIKFLRHEKWLMGDVPFYLKFWTKLTHPHELKMNSIRCPSPPKGAQNRKVTVFCIKVDSFEESLLQSFFMRKLSAAQLLGIHWPILLCINGWWGTSP